MYRVYAEGWRVVCSSHHDSLHRGAAHIGRAEVTAAVPIRELFVNEARQRQQRGVQVMDGHHAIDGGAAHVIGRAVAPAALDAEQKGQGDKGDGFHKMMQLDAGLNHCR